MKLFINDIIDNNSLTLSVSTVVKLIAFYDKLIVKCYYKGVSDYIEPENCKFCKQYQNLLKTSDVLCRKHYAIKLYNDPLTNLSEIFYREEKFKLFGRYIMRETQSCTYIFYLTPIQIDMSRFCVYACPTNLFKDRQAKFDWSSTFRKPDVINFNIDDREYRLDFTNKYKVAITDLN